MSLDASLVAELTPRVTARSAVLRERIEAHAVGEVRVVAVTKGHPPEVAAAALAAGFVDLGENYAQEMLSKAVALEGYGDLETRPRWHMIGRLQSNKVKVLAPLVDLWQTIDRASLVEAVASRAPGAEVLIQVDLAGTPGRGGCPRPEVEALVEHARVSGLDVAGLMGVGPPGPPEDSREGFAWLRATVDRLGLREASMGMSGDLEVALEEGATIVRIGSALVGGRRRSDGTLG